MHSQKYEVANKYQKTEIAERVLSIIHEGYGRFLKWEEGEGWIPVEHDMAREKISHFFRHLRSKTTTIMTEEAKKQPQAKRVTPCPSPVYSQAQVAEKASKQIRSAVDT
jgi:hypothetical protein